MKIVKQSFQILSPEVVWPGNIPDPNNAGLRGAFEREAQLIELAGRTAYKSEDRITESSYDGFIRKIIKNGHEAVIEFGSMMVKFICDRGVSHEIVRHRLCSFLQESTRYCNYTKDKFGNEITVIEPAGYNQWSDCEQIQWRDGMAFSESKYNQLIGEGLTPQQARAVLPNSLKTEICVRANFREWRHIFKLRAISKAAHPDMRSLMTPLYEQCKSLLPCVFDMGEVE
jgi:thymidylate synthase (FAD)